jgi:hypothetical protein
MRLCRIGAFAAVLSPWLTMTSGCHRGNAMSQVRGTVSCKSGELPKTGIRMIRLEPTADSKAAVRKGASASINDDGTFTLYTRQEGDGVNHGDYAVTFAFFKSAMDHHSPLLPKYTQASTTPYRVTVDKDIDDLKFEVETAAVPPRR